MYIVSDQFNIETAGLCTVNLYWWTDTEHKATSGQREVPSMVKAHTTSNKYQATCTQTAAPDSGFTQRVFKITKEAEHISLDSKLNTNRCPAEITTGLICY